MKTAHMKYAKPSINTPTSKQSLLEFSGSQYHLKQLSRYNPKLVSARPDSNINSPSPLLQKIGFSIQTPCRSSSKILYIKQKYSNITQNSQQEISPKSLNKHVEKSDYEKYTELSNAYTNYSNILNVSSKMNNKDVNKRVFSLGPKDVLESGDSNKNSTNIFGSVLKGSPTSSSQAKLMATNKRESNILKGSIQAKTQKVASPKMGSKHFLCDVNYNKENINTANLAIKADNKYASNNKFTNASDNHSYMNLENTSSEELRIHNSIQNNTEKETAGERCLNHPHKKAKYIVVSENSKQKIDCHNQKNSTYCSKCAIKMVANGHKIQELIKSPIEQRKSEIEEFLEKLSCAKRKSNAFLESIHRKKGDVTTFYSKQAEKAELIVSAILKIINEEKMRALEELSLSQEQTLEEIEDIQKQLEERLASMHSIQHDIEKNLHNILNKIDADPFKIIMNKYNEKLEYFLSFLEEQVKNHQVNVSKLPGFKRETLESLKPNLLVFFEKVIVSTSLVKKDTSPEKFAMSCKLSPQTASNKDNLQKNSLYVSFENKEIFENAINSSQQPSLQESQAQTVRRCSDLHSYTYGNKMHQIRTDADSSLKPLDSSRGGYTSPKEEPRGIVKKADIDLESFMTNRTIKTPQPSRTQQILSNTTQVKCSLNYESLSEEKMITHRPSNEFQAPQMSLLQRSFEEIPTVRYPRVVAENSIQPHSRHESCPSPDIRISNRKESDGTRFDASLSSQTNLSAKKYINILEKITTNQSRKNIEYSDLMKVNSLISPQYSDTEEKFTNESEFIRINDQLLDENGQPSERMAPDTGIICKGDIKFENFNKELKNYPPFFNFIESKLNDEKPQFTGTNYQKSLFCCSPNFKENIEPASDE